MPLQLKASGPSVVPQLADRYGIDAFAQSRAEAIEVFVSVFGVDGEVTRAQLRDSICEVTGGNKSTAYRAIKELIEARLLVEDGRALRLTGAGRLAAGRDTQEKWEL